jgi:hypothetical protein
MNKKWPVSLVSSLFNGLKSFHHGTATLVLLSNCDLYPRTFYPRKTKELKEAARAKNQDPGSPLFYRPPQLRESSGSPEEG